MVEGNIAAESRLVFRLLAAIAVVLAVTILIVRNTGVLGESQQLMDGYTKTGAMAFDVPLDRRPGAGNVDTIAWTDHPAIAFTPATIVHVSAGESVTIAGWAYDTQANSLFPGIGAKVDRSGAVEAAFLMRPRPDVATALANAGARSSGFTVDIDTSKLAVGRHVIALRALAPDQKRALALGSVAFYVDPQSVALQKTDAIDALNGVLINAAGSLAAPIGILHSANRLTIDGWGFVTDGARIANSATILVDGEPIVTAKYGLPRADVARVYHDIRVGRSGFEGSLPLASLSTGLHEIKLRLNLADGTYIDSSASVHIRVI